MANKKTIGYVVLMVAILAFLAMFSLSKKEKDYNLLIISMTGLRKDHMGVYGYKRNTTPNIDDLARRALVFENFFSVASRTVPAGISLFTSQYPYSHTILDWRQGRQLDPNIKTFTQLLKKQGYKTAAYTGGGQYKGLYGFQQGFDTYIDNNGEYVGFAPNINGALSWLEDNKNQKFFLFLQGFDPHCPYFPPPPYDAMFDPD